MSNRMFALLLLFCCFALVANTETPTFKMSDKDISNAEVAPVDSPSVSLPLRSMGSETARSAEAESPATEAEERGTIKDEQ